VRPPLVTTDLGTLHLSAPPWARSWVTASWKKRTRACDVRELASVGVDRELTAEADAVATGHEVTPSPIPQNPRPSSPTGS